MVDFIRTVTRPRDEEWRRKVASVINSHFEFDTFKRITVISDVNQFDSNQDKTVHMQGVGEIPNYHEIYWDGVWIMDFHDNMGKEAVEHDFLVGFTNAYQDNQVTINELEELEQVIKDKTIEEKIKEAAELPETSEEEKVAKKVIGEILTEKKEKVDKVRKKVDKIYGKQ